jgi:hypothetical protein
LVHRPISVAAAHGQRGILHKLLSHPLNGSSKKEMLSLEEILAEGSSNPSNDRMRGTRLMVCTDESYIPPF